MKNMPHDRASRQRGQAFHSSLLVPDGAQVHRHARGHPHGARRTAGFQADDDLRASVGGARCDQGAPPRAGLLHWGRMGRALRCRHRVRHPPFPGPVEPRAADGSRRCFPIKLSVGAGTLASLALTGNVLRPAAGAFQNPDR